MEQQKYIEKGFAIDMGPGEDSIFVNVAACADDLILWSATRNGIDDMLTRWGRCTGARVLEV
jgi:hypothetical protein